jgi:hypothetical protein
VDDLEVEGSTNAWTYSTRRSGAALNEPTRYTGCEQKLPWMTRELTSLKNNKTKASKTEDSEKWCVKDDAIDNCERLRENFVIFKEEYQQQHGRAYDDYRARIEDAIKSGDIFLDMLATHQLCILKVVWPLFAEFIQRTYTDDVWVPSDPGPEHVPDDPPFHALQFTSDGSRAFCKIWMSTRVLWESELTISDSRTIMSILKKKLNIKEDLLREK